MISLLSMAVHTITGLFISILKAVFSMLSWFLGLFFKLLKLFFCALPITAVLFSFMIILNLVILISGSREVLNYIPASVDTFVIGGMHLFSREKNTALIIFDALKSWWFSNIYSYHGSSAYLPLLLLTIIMFIPVISIFLCISVFSSFANLLFFIIVADIALYLVRALVSKSFLNQFLDRYYFLFPESGKRHYEKSYEKWLRKHHEEFENDTYGQDSPRDKYDDFYEDDEDDEYDSDYDEEYDDEYEQEYDSDYDEEEFYEDEDYESDEFYEDDDYDDPDCADKNSRFENPAPMTTFDFFAGCSSRESVEKKYRSLAKLYHPDNMDGDTAALQEINVQYEEAKKRFPRQE